MDYERIQDPSGKIPVNEPVFLIRGQDSVGGDAVRAWADLYLAKGGDPRIAESARAQAILMDAWSVKKLADVPPGTPIVTMTKIDMGHGADHGSPGD
jgi:hypothetical protein